MIPDDRFPAPNDFATWADHGFNGVHHVLHEENGLFAGADNVQVFVRQFIGCIGNSKPSFEPTDRTRLPK